MPFWNVLILAITVLASYRGFKNRQFTENYLFSPIHVLRDKQVYRLVTSGFLHANWMHLLFNMFSLYSFGGPIEILFGAPTFLLVYFASIIGGGLLSLWIHRNHEYRALGASGGVCGIIFASIFLLQSGVTIFPLPLTIPSWLYALLFILISFVGMRSQAGNIGHDAHLGGALVGLAAATALYPAILIQRPFLYGTVVAVSLLLFLYSWKYPLLLQTSHPLSREHWRRIGSDILRMLGPRKVRNDPQTLDRLLDKISRSGMESLTFFEKKELEAISKRRNRTGAGR